MARDGGHEAQNVRDVGVAKENVKEPKGSKLDAKKRAEYQTDLVQAESWDTSGWSTWIVTGRVLPERCDVNVGAVISHGVGAGGRYRVRLEV